MDLEARVAALEEKIAALEVQVQGRQEVGLPHNFEFPIMVDGKRLFPKGDKPQKKAPPAV